MKRSNTQFERQVDIDRRIRAGELVALLLARRALGQYEGLALDGMLNHFYGQLLESAGRQIGASAEQIIQGFSFIPPPSFPVDASIWNILCQCLLNSQSVEIVYRSASASAAAAYTMDPLHIANIEGEWYLFARSHYKGDVMQLAISRVQSARDTG